MAKGITIEIPEDSLKALSMAGVLNHARLKNELRKSVAIGLYQRHILSLEQAAKLSGLCLADFMEMLCESKIPVFEYTAEDYKQEKTTKKTWQKILKSK